jgi:hypothetical protein
MFKKKIIKNLGKWLLEIKNKEKLTKRSKNKYQYNKRKYNKRRY